MALKNEIRNAINTGKYTAVKVWEIEVSEKDPFRGTHIMRIEIEVKRNKRRRSKKPDL